VRTAHTISELSSLRANPDEGNSEVEELLRLQSARCRAMVCVIKAFIEHRVLLIGHAFEFSRGGHSEAELLGYRH
jgi:hypothetical protein